MVRPMVHSTKHYVQHSISTVVGGAVTTITVANAVEVSGKNLVSEVEEGSSIKACYMEIWARAGSTTPASGQLIFYKVEGDTSPASTIDMAALGDWDNKKNILYTTMGLFNDADADAIALFKGWIKIPKGKQRFGLGDSLLCSVFTPTIDLQICGFFTYKEYS